MKTERNAASPADVEYLRNIIARADEDLQRSMAAVMRARSTDDRADAFDALERARAALSHWLPSRLGN